MIHWKLMIGQSSIPHGEQDTKLAGSIQLVELVDSDRVESLDRQSPVVVCPK